MTDILFQEEKIKEKYNIIFLDIDGVLNSAFSFEENTKSRVPKSLIDIPHKKHIDALNKIIIETQARIVVSSSWRYYFSRVAFTYLFYFFGIERGAFLDITKKRVTDSTEYIPRRVEIAKWLEENKDRVKNFVILDDDEDACIEEYKEKYIRTYFHTGLTDSHANKAIKILNNLEDNNNGSFV